MRAAEELSTVYRDAAHYDLLAQMTAPADLPFYERLAGEHGGPILELGCGTGRISIPLAQLGHRVTGVDLSAPLLDRARLKAHAAGVDVTFVHGDVCELDLAERFALIVFPYNGFNHMLDHQRVRRCLTVAAGHLADGGRLVIDTFNPDPTKLVPEGNDVILRYVEPEELQQVVLSEHCVYDAARQVNTVTWHYEIGGRPDARVDRIEMRIFFPQELDALVHGNGLEIVDKLGDYDGSPFVGRSPKQLMVLKVAASGGASGGQV